MRTRGLKHWLGSALAGLSIFAQANAATIVGGSTLLDAAFANQLETWLGEGPIALTNIYAKAAGDDSLDFHAAVDGKGRTFVVMAATGNYGAGPTGIIGGYNPQSWRSSSAWGWTPDDAERTAFIFDLTTTRLFRQNLTSEPVFGDINAGAYQTYNNASYGPYFGGGADLLVNQTLNLGSSYFYSYSDAGNVTTSIMGPGAIYFGAIEVFTIAAAPVPEPETYAMLLAGLGLLAFAAIRRKRQIA
jgi:hypothetical protein